MPSEFDLKLIRRAMALADHAKSLGEVPVGAVLVYENEVVAEGWNTSISDNDPTAHAEMMALRLAGKVLNNYRLLDTTLYVTLEPCCMCATAMIHARVQRVVFGAYDLKTGAGGSVFNILRSEYLNHQIEVVSGVLEVECRQQLSDFFKQRRAEKKELKQQL